VIREIGQYAAAPHGRAEELMDESTGARIQALADRFGGKSSEELAGDEEFQKLTKEDLEAVIAELLRRASAREAQQQRREAEGQ
jgi:hypothetical protein